MAIYDPPPDSGPLPERVEPLRMIKRNAVSAGSIALDRMPRLRGMLASDAGHVEAALRFGMDPNRVPALTGQASGHVELECQRCLEPVTWAFDLAFRLGIVQSEGQAARLPEGYDPLLHEDGLLPLAPIVEDELILALPIVPRHETDEACQWRRRWGEEDAPPADADAAQRENPFRVLETLKTDRSDSGR